MFPLRDDQNNRTFPVMTLVIIAVNVYVFFTQLRFGLDESVAQAGFYPLDLTSHQAGGWTHLFTAMFMHGGWMHLLGNMWFLWVFGHSVEEDCGPIRYLMFYLLCGVAATLAFTALAPESTVPLVGASGAISGVLGAYLLHRPGARVLSVVPLGPFIRLMEVPAWLFLLVWIGFQVFSQLAELKIRGEQSSGVAYAAHIGGFIAGMGLIVFFERSTARRR